MELISQKIEIDCEKTSSVETALRSTVWKNEKFSLSEKKKNSSNQLFSHFLSKTIAFTKFLRKENFCNFHTVSVILRKFRNFTAKGFFAKNSSNQLYYKLIWRKKNLHCSEFLVFPYWEFGKILVKNAKTIKKISVKSTL